MKTFQEHILDEAAVGGDAVDLIVKKAKIYARDLLKIHFSSSGFAFPSAAELWEPVRESALTELREYLEAPEEQSVYPAISLFSKNLADEVFKDSRMNVFKTYQFIVMLSVEPDAKQPFSKLEAKVRFEVKPQFSKWGLVKF